MSQLVQTFIRHKVYVWNFFFGGEGGIKYFKKYFLQEHIFFRKSFVCFFFSESYFFRKVTFSKKIYFLDFFVLSSLFFFPYVKNNSCFYDLGHEKKIFQKKISFFWISSFCYDPDSLLLTHCCWLIDADSLLLTHCCVYSLLSLIAVTGLVSQFLAIFEPPADCSLGLV